MIVREVVQYVFMEEYVIDPIPVTQFLNGQDYALYEIGPFCRKGINKVKIQLKPAAQECFLSTYVTGSFSLQEKDNEYRIYQPFPLAIGDWTEQGMPFYGESVTYSKIYSFGKQEPATYLYFSNWNGSRAETYINHKQIASDTLQKQSFRINDFIQPGENRIDIKIFGDTVSLTGTSLTTEDKLKEITEKRCFTSKHPDYIRISL